jgi:hypothetical protein
VQSARLVKLIFSLYKRSAISPLLRDECSLRIRVHVANALISPSGQDAPLRDDISSESTHSTTTLIRRGREGLFMRKDARRCLVLGIAVVLCGLAVPTRSGAYP